MPSQLSITLHDLQFSKDYPYLITIIYNSQQLSTDISAITSQPIFVNSTLLFDIQHKTVLTGSVVFIAKIVVDDEDDYQNQNQSQHDVYPPQPQQSSLGLSSVRQPIHRILGQCTLDLTPYNLQPSETYNLPLRQQLIFTRTKHPTKPITIGRFIASLKIVQQDTLPTYLSQLQPYIPHPHQLYTQLPQYDHTMSFSWRVKLQLRYATNIISSTIPQSKVQLGWTQFSQILPQPSRLYSSSILNTHNPHWQQTFLIISPTHIKQPKGYLLISLKDMSQLADIIRFTIPISSMGAFIPYNLTAVVKNQDDILPTELYFSIVLETVSNRQDKLHDALVYDIVIQPNLEGFVGLCLASVWNTRRNYQPQIQYHRFDLNKDSLDRILQFDQCPEFTYHLSQQLTLPLIKPSKDKPILVLTISQHHLRRKLNLYLIGVRDTPQKEYQILGVAESVQEDFTALLIDQTKKKLFVMMNIKSFTTGKLTNCTIQLRRYNKQTHKQDNKQSTLSQLNNNSRLNHPGQQTYSQKLLTELQTNLTNTTDKTLFAHLSQNNAIISRILHQLDDKSNSLKQAAAQLSTLRNRIKLLQNQNNILRNNALQQQDNLITLIQRQVQNLSPTDLKAKILKLSQLYKTQRNKSKQLQQTINTLQPQLINTMQLNSLLVSQNNKMLVMNQTIDKLTKENQRVQVYKDTIKKQQKVIQRLERVMKEGMGEVRNARDVRLQLEQMKNKQGRTVSGASSYAQRGEIQRLQTIIAELQIKNNSGQSSTDYELQFKLHQAETRISSLQQQIEQQSRTYARQLAMYKMRIAEKQAILDGYQK